MKYLKILIASLMVVFASLSHAVSVSGNVALTTDYVWRGMTQNAEDPSISGGFDLETDMGFYLGTWAANVSGGTSSIELDYYLGFSGAMTEDSGYDVGYISFTYPGNDSLDFEELYLTFDFYGVYISYFAGLDDAADNIEIGYGVEAGPGSFNIAYGDYDTAGQYALIGYDWTVGDFTLGFYYSDFESDAGAASDQDGAYFTISY